MATPPVDVVDLKLHLQMDPNNTANDTELTSHLAAATNALEGLVGPMLPRQVTQRRTAANGTITLPVRPVLSVESVAGVPLSGTVDAATADLEASAAGVVRTVSTTLPNGRYDVTWTAGRDPVGEHLKLAVLIVAAHLWETQRNRGARRAMLGDENPNPYQDSQLVMRGFSLPRRALELVGMEGPGMVTA